MKEKETLTKLRYIYLWHIERNKRNDLSGQSKDSQINGCPFHNIGGPMSYNEIRKKPCNNAENDVSLEQEPTNLENENSAQTTVSNLRNITTRNGCTATLFFSEKGNLHIRREVAELLLRSVQKRSEAT